MNDKHLQDSEIEALLDGESGEEAAAWRAHLRSCGECRLSVARGEALIQGFAALPSLAPSPGFANRVLEETRGIVPWHVAARAAIERVLSFVPGAGWVAAGGMSAAGMVLTALALWLAPRSDAVAFAGQIGMQSLGLQVMPALRGVAETLLGVPAVSVIEGAGRLGIAGALCLMLLTGLSTVVGLRASASRRVRG